MKFGLKEKTIKLLQDFFQKYPEITEVKIYGSRALGNFVLGSDIDLVVFGNLQSGQLAHFLTELDELPTPYMFDLVDYAQIKHKPLKEHIDKHSKVLFKK